MMLTKKKRLVVLIVSVAMLAGGNTSSAQKARSITAEWTFQGRVYEGDVGVEPPGALPLEGVTVSVYGASDPHPDPGTFIRSTTTDATGWYDLTVYDDDGAYRYYYILETDPAGYVPVGATTVSGTVRTPNWIEYVAPLDGQTLTGNKFWDYPAPVLSGHVYAGDTGVEPPGSTPISNTTVSLYCADNQGEWGTLLRGTTTDATGWYELAAGGTCEYYNIVEIDPAGYVSAGSTSVSGTVVTDNWIQYAYPLIGQTYVGNKFWDRLEITLPDLVVTDLWHEDNRICYQVMNAGNAVALGGHLTSLSVDDTNVISQPVEMDLEPDERWSTCFDYEWACTPPEDWLVVRADHDGVVEESDEANNIREENLPCDVMPPGIISGPVVIEVTQNSALVTWETSENSDSRVRYGATATFYTSEEVIAVMTTTHRVPLAGLEPSTTYHFRVQSTDPNGNTVEGPDKTFETLPTPDEVDPSVSFLIEPGVYSGTLVIPVDGTDNIGIERVEFYLDGELVFIDYSPPYQAKLDTSLYANGPHTLTARGYDLAGRFSHEDLHVDWSNAKDITYPSVKFLSPAEGAIVFGNPVTVTVAISDDLGLIAVNLFVIHIQGTTTNTVHYDAKVFDSPLPKQATVSFAWNTYQAPLGTYYLKAQVVDNTGKFNDAHRYVSLAQIAPIPLAQAQLKIVQQKVTRSQNQLTVEVRVKNVGGGTASNIYISHGLRAFQPISTTTSLADYSSWYNQPCRYGNMRIYPKVSMAPGAEVVYTYNAVPILHHPNPPAPEVGGNIDITWKNPDGSKGMAFLKLPVLQTTGGETMSQAHASALKCANYLIVTDPAALWKNYVSFYDQSNADRLLSAMASLAKGEYGALGYIEGSLAWTGTALKSLLATNGAWNKALHPGFSTFGGGYLLIVGEESIIPATTLYPFCFEITGKGFTCYSVELSDFPYADINGDQGPDLIVGRIIGDDLPGLIQAIEVAELARSSAASRSTALLVSGTGKSEQALINSVNDIQKLLIGWTVDPLHCKNYSNCQAQFLIRAPNKDVIYIAMHGNTTGFHDMYTLGFPTNFPFGNKHPLVFAHSCWTGNYSKGSVVDNFFASGAAVYIGYPVIGLVESGSSFWKAFFQSWSAGEPVGKNLFEQKKGYSVGADESRFWMAESNLYGDPKLGAPAHTAPTAVTFDTQVSPLSNVEVVIPDYEVTDIDGFDYVEIPGGQLLQQHGKYRIPYYLAQFDLPVGFEAQDVYLVERSGLITDTGLNIPVSSAFTLTLPGESHDTVVQTTEWMPEEDFRWGVVENPDGTATVFITVYPFYYNPLTTDVRFYKNYTFFIDQTASEATITSLATDSDQYPQGAPVVFDVEIQNLGLGQDAVFGAVIRRYSTGEVMDGLQLDSLKELRGDASLSAVWDSEGKEPGYYYIEATLKSASGVVLDRKTQAFRLGISSGVVSDFTATPAIFDVGNPIYVSMTFSNTGTITITGAAVILVRDESGAVVRQFTHEITGLHPGFDVSISDTWDTSAAGEGTYSILGYVSFDSMTSEPVSVIVTTERRVYLPLVQR